MTEQRRIRVQGRPQYGRVAPLSRRSQKRGGPRLKLSGLQLRLLGLLVVIVVVGWGTLQLFEIKTVTVKVPNRGGEVESESRRLVEGNFWWGNMLTFDSEAFAAKLQHVDPLLRNVSVKRRWMHAIEVTASLKQPSMAWSTGNQGYILDRDGTVIGAVTSPGGLPLVYDGSNLPVEVGQKAASGRFVEFVSALVPALAKNGLAVTRLDIKDTTIDLTATTNKGYRLLFDTSRGVDEEIADLQAVQRLLVAQKKTPAEYIDLRISGKAYYK
jgi:cell division septal protein FtsQ